MQDLKEGRDLSVDIRGKNIPGRRTVQCKGPEAGTGQLCPRNGDRTREQVGPVGGWVTFPCLW